MVDIQTLSLEEIRMLLETEGEHIQPLLQATWKMIYLSLRSKKALGLML